MIGERLKEIRKDYEYTQETFAKALNVSPSTVHSWETNNRDPSHEMLVQICRVLRVSADFLLGITDEDPILKKCNGELKPNYRRLLNRFEQVLWEEQEKENEQATR